MSVTFWACYVILFILSTYCFIAIVQSKKSKLLEYILVIYFLSGFLIAAVIYIYKEINPFDREQIIRGIIVREKEFCGKRSHCWLVSYYSYNVNGKEYEGSVIKDKTYMRGYSVGDTIDITYNQDEHSASRATHTQYWYINSSKKKYLDRIIQQVGKRYL